MKRKQTFAEAHAECREALGDFRRTLERSGAYEFVAGAWFMAAVVVVAEWIA